jgi:hypothetical protein
MKKSRARRWLQLPQAKRSQALAVLMGALDEGIDLHRLLDAEMQMRKAGVLLNQALHLTHGGKAALDTALVADAVRIIKGLRP